MQSEMLPLYESDSLRMASETFIRTRHHGLLVINDKGELVGVITVQDLDRAQTGDGLPAGTVGDICTRQPLVTYPDESLGAALRRMSARDIGRVPVVARDNPRRPLGVLRRSDLVRAYDIALTRRAAMRHRAHQVRLGAFSGVNVVEVAVEAGAPCAGKRISQVGWPRDCVIATLRRGRQVLIPHGDTVLKAGDVLVATIEGEADKDLRRICAAPGKSQNGTAT